MRKIIIGFSLTYFLSFKNFYKYVNLFVNPNEHFFDMNKTTDLSNYTNFAKLFTQRKIKDKLNKMNNSEKENNIETNNSLNIFKYTKKIVSHNNFNNKNESNNNNFSLKNNNIPIYNYIIFNNILSILLYNYIIFKK